MPVLGTKLRVPTPRRQLVGRDRLLRHLDTDPHASPRMVLVTAPAGFGKTTLLSQWVTGVPHRGRVAWLSLDAGDSDPRVFLRHLLAATRLVLPEVGDEAEALLEADGASVEHAVASLVNDLDAAGASVVLALDDYHVIDNPAVHEAVAFLVDNIPPGVTVAMTTRADPPLPVARMRARGELHEVRAADLRFTREEAERFLNDVMGLGLDSSLVEALEAKTEGWAAGLQMAALSARGRSDGATGGARGVEQFIQDFAGTHRFVLDYLLEEVLATQPDALGMFLVHTSVVDQLTAPLCDALTGRGDAQQMLEKLDHDNVFLIPLDDERRWFRYHHLFADVLRAKLLAEDPALAFELHRKASFWYAEHGSLTDAIPHALSAGDIELAADLIDLDLPAARRRRDDRRISAWLEAIPETAVLDRPLLAAQQAWAQLSQGDLAGALRWLDHAEARLPIPPSPQTASRPAPDGVGDATTSDASKVGSTLASLADRGAVREASRSRDDDLRALPAQLAVYRASVAQAGGDTDATVAYARRALELAGPEDHLARSGGAGFLGLAAWAAGNVTEAIETFTLAMQALRDGGHLTDELGTTVVLAQMWWAQGQPTRARHLYEESLRRAERHPGAAFSVLGDLHVGLAAVLREHDDLSGAHEHLDVAQKLGERASLPENRHRWYTVMAALRAAHGDDGEALSLLDTAEALYQPGFFPDLWPVAATRARLHIAAGRLDEAHAWVEHHRPRRDSGSFLTEYTRLTWVRLGIAQHRARVGTSEPDATTGHEPDSAPGIDEVVGELDRVLTTARHADRGGTVVEALWLRALAHHARGDEERALDDLDEALRLGLPAGYVRMFLDEGTTAVDLLRIAATRGVDAAGAAAALLSAAGADVPQTRTLTTDPATGHPPDLVEDLLSARELEVLRLLDSDLAGPEIARRLFMSINTFRTHSRHIFTKLDVNTRRAAVARAKDLDLL